MRRKNRVPILIIRFTSLMHGAITFDHQAGSMTEKIGDKSGDDLLTPEVQTHELIVSQLAP